MTMIKDGLSETEDDLDDMESFPQTPVLDPTPEAEVPKEPSITGLTFEELAGSMTGFDRIAIPKMFGTPLNQISTDMSIYVGLFVWHRHNGMSDQGAFDAACNTTSEDAQRYFETDDEITPDTPETESGKD